MKNKERNKKRNKWKLNPWFQIIAQKETSEMVRKYWLHFEEQPFSKSSVIVERWAGRFLMACFLSSLVLGLCKFSGNCYTSPNKDSCFPFPVLFLSFPNCKVVLSRLNTEVWVKNDKEDYGEGGKVQHSTLFLSPSQLEQEKNNHKDKTTKTKHFIKKSLWKDACTAWLMWTTWLTAAL